MENVVKVMKKELALECDYVYEMKSQARFRKLINEDEICREFFSVPNVIPELTSERILATEWVNGVSIDKVKSLPQEVRNNVGARILHITLKELFVWKFMQTDPNWGNFLYNEETGKLALIDFGAAREYPEHFVDNYLHMVKACAERNRDEAISRSIQLGFLTGEHFFVLSPLCTRAQDNLLCVRASGISLLYLIGDENKVMLDAHCETGFIVGLPFGTDGEYDFAAHSKNVTKRVTELGMVMLKNRLCSPPDEGYSLHRKLSGAFLCCIKLGAVIPSKQIFNEVCRLKSC